MVLLETEDACFGRAAGEDPWMGVSGTKLQKMGLGKQFDVECLVVFSQTNFGNSSNVDE